MAEQSRTLTPEEWDGLINGELQLRSDAEEEQRKRETEMDSEEKKEAIKEESVSEKGPENEKVTVVSPPPSILVSEIPEPKMLGEWLKGTAFGVAIGVTIGALAAYAAVRIIVNDDKESGE